LEACRSMDRHYNSQKKKNKQIIQRSTTHYAGKI